MSTDVTQGGASLSATVAEEIRALMGRRQISKAQLSRRLGVDETWVGRRLNGRHDLGLAELERIATALDVTVVDLFPRNWRRVTETSPAIAPVRIPRQTTRRPRDNRPIIRSDHSTRPDGSRRPVRIG